MNREIKFRVWNVDSKKMIDLKQVTPLALSIDMNGIFIPFNDRWILMQHTGINDFHEGDCLGISRVGDDPEYIGNIVYDTDLSAFVVYRQNGGFEYLAPFFKEFPHSFIIGDIYSNPELLK